MKILVFGAKGYLGQQFLQILPESIGSSADIADQKAVKTEIEKHQPDVIINAAGKTGRPNVDWCEDHKLETIRANVTGPLVLLDECMSRGIYSVHLSSGCIYEGDNNGVGFSETDAPNFSGSFYARTKAWSDQILKEFPVLTLRLRMPFDNTLNDRTLLAKLLKYSRVLDVQNSITYLPDFLAAASLLIGKRRTGVYNIVNPGTISPYEMMQSYKEHVDPSHTFERLTLDQLPSVTKAGRSNCVLSGKKLQGEGIELRQVHNAIEHAWTVIQQAQDVAHRLTLSGSSQQQ